MNPDDPSPPSPRFDSMRALAHLADLTEKRDPASAPALVASIGDEAGTMIGRYKLLEKLGEGGFGIVWLAEQTGDVRRSVALKLIKPGMASADIMRRFDTERQALAIMDHPNIARVFDAGTTGDGRPYFVMERVDGLPLTTYCDEHRFSIRARLELFIQVCAAVQHAHQKAVLHRDLKPTNILVTEVDGQPVPKVIDFGIAKALQQPLTGNTLVTLHGGIFGTPQYMSPEQVSTPGDVDTRSDVYALGVILYELLTGVSPLSEARFKGAAMDEVMRIIREEGPARPSSRVIPITDIVRQSSAARSTEPTKLNRALRGDLDWITLKALEKERERRYGSAAALAQDIERHIGNEPVEAGPPSAAYRLKKAIVRNKRLVISVTAIFLCLIFGLTGISIGLFKALRMEREMGKMEKKKLKAEEEKKQAEWGQQVWHEQAEHAQAVKDFLKDLVIQNGNQGEVSSNLTLHEILDKASMRIDELFKDNPSKAELLFIIGEAYRELGSVQQALPCLGKAVELRKMLLGPEHSDTLIGMNNLAMAYQDSGKLDEALALYEETLKRQTSLFGRDDLATLATMNNLANAYRDAGNIGESLSLCEECYKLRKSSLGVKHMDTLTSMNNLAVTYRALGKLDIALNIFEETYKLRLIAFGQLDGGTITSMNNLASAYRDAGRLDEALPLLETAVELQKVAHGRQHPHTMVSMHNLAKAYQEKGKFDQALTLYEETFGLRESILGKNNSDTVWTEAYLSLCYSETGRKEEAKRTLADAASKVESLPEADAKELRWIIEKLAAIDDDHGQVSR